jgi:dTDP-4-dehydrorhamnose 3,5-epimerase-like enzyme
MIGSLVNTQKYTQINLPKIQDSRGNLTFVEANRHIPFEIKRVFYLYDVPGNAKRGAHAHKESEQFIIAISGSFEISVDDGLKEERYQINRSDCGLYIGSMLWHELSNFSSGTVCMVLASNFYDESDYYRNYKDFFEAIKSRK